MTSRVRPTGRDATVGEDAHEQHDLLVYARDVLSLLTWRVPALLVFTLLLALLEGLGLALLAPLLQLVGLDVGTGPVDRIALTVARTFDGLGVPIVLPTLLSAFVGLVVLQAALQRAQTLYAYRLQQRFIARLRFRLHGALLNAEWSFLLRHRSSDFMHKLTRELDNVGGATFNLVHWFAGILITIVYLGFAIYLSPVITALVVAAGASLSLALWSRTRLARRRGGELSEAYESLFAALSEHFQGLKTAKSHGVEAAHAAHFAAMSHRVEEAQVAVIENQQATAFWFRIGSMAILALMIYVAVDGLALAPATIAVLLYLFSRLIPRLTSIQSGYQSFMGFIPSYTRVRRLEDECRDAAESIAGAAAPRLRHGMAFRGVSFGFTSARDDVVVDAVDLVLPAGSTTAIVGSSGAGKTTLADLACGLLRPTEGRIEVDGRPLEDDEIASWRARIGYVSQDAFVFHDTVRANLTLTRPGASDVELDEALDLAEARFLRRLPEGLETVLGDRGVRLSGGERQRLALARALLRKPDLLILDEATSALDAENERKIQQALETLHGKMTILLIAHRLATVRRVDRIYVLEHGRVVESGTWATLLAAPAGRFRHLANLQGLPGTVAAP